MINLKDIKRVKEFKIEEGAFYLLDISTAKKIEISRGFDIKDTMTAMEQMEVVGEQMITYIDNMLCDKKGELLNYSKDDLESLPGTVFTDISEAVQSLLFGQKKS